MLHPCILVDSFVPHFALDVLLNLIWVGICVSALAWAGRREAEHFRISTARARIRRVAAVAFVALALFPSVSDSDDLFTFSLMHVPLGHGGAGNVPLEESKEKASLHLASLLETLHQDRAGRIYTFALALFFLSILVSFRPEFLTRSTGCRSGRAPPIA
jgi:hypothetical protein